MLVVPMSWANRIWVLPFVSVLAPSSRYHEQQGKQIKEIAIQHRGQGQVTLDANSLSAGTYQYTLILDGRMLETKQMVLTRN